MHDISLAKKIRFPTSFSLQSCLISHGELISNDCEKLEIVFEKKRKHIANCNISSKYHSLIENNLSKHKHIAN